MNAKDNSRTSFGKILNFFDIRGSAFTYHVSIIMSDAKQACRTWIMAVMPENL